MGVGHGNPSYIASHDRTAFISILFVLVTIIFIVSLASMVLCMFCLSDWLEHSTLELSGERAEHPSRHMHCDITVIAVMPARRASSLLEHVMCDSHP